MAAEIFRRYELKYRLPLDTQDVIRAYIAPHTRPDPCALERAHGLYTVRSTYFDTRDFRFYFERQDGLKVRKKLRIRVYNEVQEDPVLFMEIKRKFNRSVFKERITVRHSSLNAVLDGVSQEPEGHLLESSLQARQTLGRFRYILIGGDMLPVVHVVYEREAYMGHDNPRVRVTFDKNLRSLAYPALDDLYNEDDLRPFLDRHFVLELKFDQVMPSWMRRMVKHLRLSAHAYSKYCTGIDAWLSLAE